MQPELKLKVITFGKASTSSPCKRGVVEQIYKRNETALSVEENKKSLRRTDDIEALSVQLGSLQINEETSTDEYERTDTEMSTAPAPMAVEIGGNVLAGLPKSMVPDPGWFDGDRSKFEDW